MCVGGFCPARPLVVVEENYYPNLFNKHLRPCADNGGYVAGDGSPALNVPVVTCHICHEELDVMGTAVSSKEPCEEARVLQCGHIVGKDCFRAWLKSCLGDGGGAAAAGLVGHGVPVRTKVECPACKAPAACVVCGVVLSQAILPTRRSGCTGVFEPPDHAMLGPGSQGRRCIECFVFHCTRLCAVMHLTPAHQELFPGKPLHVGALGAVADMVPVTRRLADRAVSGADLLEIVRIGPWAPRASDPPEVAPSVAAAIDKMNRTVYPLLYTTTWTGSDGWAMDEGIFMFGAPFFKDAIARFGTTLVVKDLMARCDALAIARDTPLDRLHHLAVAQELGRREDVGRADKVVVISSAWVVHLGDAAR